LTPGWREFFNRLLTPNFFLKPLLKTDELIVPTICLYEVFKKVLIEFGEGEALQAVALMRQGRIIQLDSAISLAGAKISYQEKLPMADSVILATAKNFEATLWTQDDHFSGRKGVKFKSKR